MAINPVSNAAFRSSANYIRRSNDAEESKNPFDNPIKSNSANRKSGLPDQGAGHGAGGFSDSLPKFDRLEDVLTRLNATKSDAKGTDEQLQQTMDGFQSQFTNSAQNAEAFHSLMQTAFGDKYNKQEAENIRQQTLAGDFWWMPTVEVVDDSTLTDTSGAQSSGVGMGAYDSASDTIYLTEELLAGDPQQAIDILTEEVGHAIDARVNTSDTAGDEGELFARLVSGETLSAAQIQAARSENDHGTIEIDGETVEVEYSLFSSIGNFISDVGGAIVDTVTDVGGAVVDTVTGVGGAVVDAVTGVGGAVVNVVTDVGGAISNGIKDIGGLVSDGIGSFGNVLTDGVNWAADKLTDGLDFLNDKIVSPVLNAVPVVGPFINDHLVQPVFGVLETGVSIGAHFINAPIEFTTHALSGAVDITTNLLAGDFNGAFDSAVETVQTLFQDAVNSVLTTGALALNGITTFIDDAFNLSATRGLTADEQAYLETIFGDSLDYDEIEIQVGGGIEETLFGFNTPNAMENTIFIPESFYENDVLTEEGMDLLAHEAAHVWQFQTDGAGYIGDAIGSYLQSSIDQGNTKGAYDFTTAIIEMKPWNAMTPDEQAEIAMVIGEALEAGDGTLTRENLQNAINNHNDNSDLGTIVLDDDQFDYLDNIHDTLLAG